MLTGKVKSVVEHQYEATLEDGRWVAGDPSFIGHWVMNYDRDGNYMESVALNYQGDTAGHSVVERKDGKIVEEEFHSVHLKRTTRTILEWVSDEQANFEIWEGEVLHYEGANFYDSRGRILRQIRHANGQEITNHYKYEKDLLVENYHEDLDGNRTFTQQYEYQDFDRKGNWTTRLIYAGGEKITPDLVVKREIEYY
ncbi:MAG: hypothetical protein EHM46_05230 [Bacteroidetes bacterium]|nr:MAG: hypothetical protein EHM46_05230 [Bacteroidota bacterium]